MSGKKYDTSGLIEAQFEYGSRGVLKNLMGIKSKREMDKIETLALKEAEDYLFGFYGKGRQFTAKDVCDIHRVWLGKIYPWAGRYRQVDLRKEGFPFANALQIDNLMRQFEKAQLSRYTPCGFKGEKLARALAEVHVELVLIHPFRDGNGRVARVLSTLMALQADLPPLDFSTIQQGAGKREYIRAVQTGMSRDYSLMKKVMTKILKKTLVRRSLR